MKKLLTAIILGIALTGVSLAQNLSKGLNGKSATPRIAVVEFGDGSGSMTAEAKRQLQSSIAFALVKNREFEVPDVRNTRAASGGPNISPSAAVKLGKQLGVNYVLIGTVTEYSTTGGRMTVNTQLVDVATGRVKLSGDTTGESTSAMTIRAGHAEMSVKVVKPLIEKLKASISAAVD